MNLIIMADFLFRPLLILGCILKERRKTTPLVLTDHIHAQLHTALINNTCININMATPDHYGLCMF
jgi:hypothetical protein